MNKEQLKQQLEEMKAKVAEMEAELNKPDKFEWEYPKGKTYLISHSYVIDGMDGHCKDYFESGRYRLKKENAELSLQRNKEANLIAALAEQLDPDWKADWQDTEQERHYIRYDHKDNKYCCGTRSFFDVIGIPYMSIETARKIRDMLNSGEFKL